MVLFPNFLCCVIEFDYHRVYGLDMDLSASEIVIFCLLSFLIRTKKSNPRLLSISFPFFVYFVALFSFIFVCFGVRKTNERFTAEHKQKIKIKIRVTSCYLGTARDLNIIIFNSFFII